MVLALIGGAYVLPVCVSTDLSTYTTSCGGEEVMALDVAQSHDCNYDYVILSSTRKCRRNGKFVLGKLPQLRRGRGRFVPLLVRLGQALGVVFFRGW